MLKLLLAYTSLIQWSTPSDTAYKCNKDTDKCIKWYKQDKDSDWQNVDSWNCYSCRDSDGGSCPSYSSHTGCTTTSVDCYYKIEMPAQYANEQYVVVKTAGTTTTFGSTPSWVTIHEQTTCPLNVIKMNKGFYPNYQTGSVIFNTASGVVTAQLDKAYSVTLESVYSNIFMTINMKFRLDVQCTSPISTLSQPASLEPSQTVLIPTVDGSRPCFSFDTYENTYDGCYVLYVVSATYLGTDFPAYFSAAQTTINTGNLASYKICMADDKIYAPGTYKFYLKGYNPGGDSIAPNQQYELTLECRYPQGKSEITENPTAQDSQIIDIGNDLSAEINQFSFHAGQGCPIPLYRVGTVADHSTWPTGLGGGAADNIVSPSNGNLVVTADVTDQAATYTFYIYIPLYVAGTFAQYGPYTMKYSCENVVSTVTSYNGVYSLQFPVGSGYVPKEFSLLSASTSECTFVDYSIHFNMGDGTLADQPVITTSADFEADGHLEITFDTTLLDEYTFYVKGVTLAGDEYISNGIDIVVDCHGVTVDLTQSSTKYVFDREPGVTKNLQFTTLIEPFFIVGDPQCPIVQYQVTWSEAQLSFFSQATASSTYATLDVGTAMDHTVTVRGLNIVGTYQDFQVRFIVCGHEQLQLTGAPVRTLEYEKKWEASPVKFTDSVLRDMFEIVPGTSHDSYCEEIEFELFLDQALTIQDKLYNVELVEDSGNWELTINDSLSIVKTEFYLRQRTRGLVDLGQGFTLEVCGLETVYLTDEDYFISRKYREGSGLDQVYVVNFTTEIVQWFYTDSEFCAVVANYSLHPVKDPFVFYAGPSFKLDKEFNLDLMTVMSGQFWAYIRAAPIMQMSEVYLPVRLTVYLPNLEGGFGLINQPPFFDFSPAPAFFTPTEKQPQLVLTLPPILDSHENFCGIRFYSEDLGYGFFTNNTSFSDTKPEQQQSVLFSYDFNTNAVTLDFSEVKNRSELAGEHILKVTLLDDLYEEAYYGIILTIIEEELEEEVEEYIVEEEIREANPCTAKIVSVDQFGQLTVEFNHEMLTSGFNLTELNEEVLDLYVKPAKDYHLEDFNFNLSQLNLTWQADSYGGKTLKLNISFFDPISISPLPEQDMLILHVRQPAPYFLSKETMGLLSEDHRTLQIKLRKQMRDTVGIRQFESGAMTSQQSMKGIIGSTLVINIFIAGSLSYLFGMINSLQIIIHMPILNFVQPGNSMMFFQIMIPIVMFDILENNGDVVLEGLDLIGVDGRVLVGEEDEEIEEGIPDQMINLGFEAYNPVKNLGTLGFFTGLYFIKVVFFFVFLKPISFVVPQIKSAIDKLQRQLFFGEILLTFQEGYIEFLIVLYLHTIRPDSLPASVFDTSAVLLIAVIALIIIPALIVWLSLQPQERMQEEEFIDRWSAIIENTKQRTKMERVYLLIFITRRLIFVTLAFLVIAIPSFQGITMNLLNLSIIIYQGGVKPLDSRLRNRIELTNEFFITVAFYHLLVFTDFAQSKEAQFTMGWSLIIVVILHILFNIIILGFKIGRQIKLIGIKIGKIIQRQYNEYFVKPVPQESMEIKQEDLDMVMNKKVYRTYARPIKGRLRNWQAFKKEKTQGSSSEESSSEGQKSSDDNIEIIDQKAVWDAANLQLVSNPQTSRKRVTKLEDLGRNLRIEKSKINALTKRHQINKSKVKPDYQ